MKKHCSIFCAGWWPFLLLPLLLLAVVLFFEHRPIEERVAENTRANLKSIGADWAEVETHNRGRDVLIGGSPSNLEQVDAVRDQALSAAGVRVVEVTSEVSSPVAPPSDPSLKTLISGDSVELNGVLADQAAVDAVVAQATTSFGAGNVINNLRVGEHTAQLADTGELFSALKRSASDLSMELDGQSMTVTGELPSSTVKQNTLSAVKNSFSGTVIDRLTIAAPIVVAAPQPVAPAPVKIERNVCEETIAGLLNNAKINFDTGSSNISPTSFELLENIATTAKRCSDANFEVAGHTDSTGSLDGNMRLSEQRAQAVVSFLLKAGLPSTQFTAAGYGPNKPIADNTTTAGRAQNRRIEFRLKN